MTCRELEATLSLRAVGALSPEEAAAVEAHLARCPGCRAEAEAATEVLQLARLPPASAAELGAVSSAGQTLGRAVRRARGRRRAGRWAAGIAVAASLAAATQLPRRGPAPVGGEPRAPWEPPSMEELWSASAVLELRDEEPVVEVDDVLAGIDPGLEEP
ncbi:anti-sigma factor family protein [Anaeromyxobacter diazotrophicus]|uniref:Putative zinc-finger domain-containing protein n=1 Tax=Anaeromyxobacter diazotrophicus TaxID=2590199 RepID=A0A7I9VMV8_9BACT|nr:zf-HC2 domain-containing protein [Anaeromyxobacter diazotrophicus]GEJ57734.1 hypothetical protein AMYX_24750 [Anaeromyxobacter diazotrophicus]